MLLCRGCTFFSPFYLSSSFFFYSSPAPSLMHFPFLTFFFFSFFLVFIWSGLVLVLALDGYPAFFFPGFEMYMYITFLSSIKLMNARRAIYARIRTDLRRLSEIRNDLIRLSKRRKTNSSCYPLIAQPYPEYSPHGGRVYI